MDKVRTKDIELDEKVSFDDMLLAKPILSGLKQAGFFKPSPIQLKAIPLGKLGLDLIIQAKSGTGKTIVFGVISLEHILASNNAALQVLILAPTREIAIQIGDVIKSISGGSGAAAASNAKVQYFIGGSSLKQDKIKLKSCQIAIGTPGRVLHLITENLLNTCNIRLFVLDEADKLLAPEFQDSINLIYSKLPDNKQMITLSATYPTYMASYATRYMRSPTFVRLNIIDPSLRGIRQFFKTTPYSERLATSFDHKVDELVKLLSSVQFQQAIIFTNYQIKGENLCKILNSKGWTATFTSGNLEQTQRNLVMTQLKEFKCRILVSTDLTSRGIDSQNVDLIVNMDLPADTEAYLHRIGRAGRYGSEGTAITLVSEREETAQFEEMIDAYKLRIKQFDKNLDDVISMRNFAENTERVDDVTIEKVNISKEELDKSLFDYEQNKNSTSRMRRDKTSSVVHQDIESLSGVKHHQAISQSIVLPRLSEIQKSLDDFIGRGSSSSSDTVQLSSVDNTNRCRRRGNRNDLAQVVEKRREINSIFESKLDVDKKNEAKADVKNSFYNLKELYKWETVAADQSSKPPTGEKDQYRVVEQEEEEEPEREDNDDHDNLEQLIWNYSSNYSYYYTYFMNQLLMKQ